MKLVVGLGNPGPQYRETRHNVGFLVIDELAQRWRVEQWRELFESLTAKTVVDAGPVLLAKPMTFMNLSGQSIAGLAGFTRSSQPTCSSSATTRPCRWRNCGRAVREPTAGTTD